MNLSFDQANWYKWWTQEFYKDVLDESNLWVEFISKFVWCDFPWLWAWLLDWILESWIPFLEKLNIIKLSLLSTWNIKVYFSMLFEYKWFAKYKDNYIEPLISNYNRWKERLIALFKNNVKSLAWNEFLLKLKNLDNIRDWISESINLIKGKIAKVIELRWLLDIAQKTSSNLTNNSIFDYARKKVEYILWKDKQISELGLDNSLMNLPICELDQLIEVKQALFDNTNWIIFSRATDSKYAKVLEKSKKSRDFFTDLSDIVSDFDIDSLPTNSIEVEELLIWFLDKLSIWELYYSDYFNWIDEKYKNDNTVNSVTHYFELFKSNITSIIVTLIERKISLQTKNIPNYVLELAKSENLEEFKSNINFIKHTFNLSNYRDIYWSLLSNVDSNLLDGLNELYYIFEWIEELFNSYFSYLSRDKKELKIDLLIQLFNDLDNINKFSWELINIVDNLPGIKTLSRFLNMKKSGEWFLKLISLIKDSVSLEISKILNTIIDLKLKTIELSKFTLQSSTNLENLQKRKEQILKRFSVDDFISTYGDYLYLVDQDRLDKLKESHKSLETIFLDKINELSSVIKTEVQGNNPNIVRESSLSSKIINSLSHFIPFRKRNVNAFTA